MIGATAPHPTHHGQDWLSFRGVNRAREEQFQSHTLSAHQILRPILTVNKYLKQASQPHHRGSVHPAKRKVTSRLQRTSLIQKREKLPNISDADEDQTPFVLPRSNEIFSRPQMTRGSEQAMITLLHFF